MKILNMLRTHVIESSSGAGDEQQKSQRGAAEEQQEIPYWYVPTF
jgi:hypothetical protein